MLVLYGQSSSDFVRWTLCKRVRRLEGLTHTIRLRIRV